MNVRASVDSTTTTVGGRVLLTLEVEGADGIQVAAPSPQTEVAPFLLRAAAVREGAAAPTVDLVLVAAKPGELEIPPVAIPARTSAGADTTLSSPPVRVFVASNLEAAQAASDSATSTAAPADYKPALEAPRDWRPVGIALAALALGVVLGFLRWRRLRALRRPAPAPADAPRLPKKALRPAWEIALEELERIARAGHVGRGELKEQYVETSDALRRYLENRWGVPALESTTDELRAPLERIALDRELRARMVDLLAEADLVKFAKARPEAQAADALVDRVREIVAATTPRPALAAPPGAPAGPPPAPPREALS